MNSQLKYVDWGVRIGVVRSMNVNSCKALDLAEDQGTDTAIMFWCKRNFAALEYALFG